MGSGLKKLLVKSLATSSVLVFTFGPNNTFAMKESGKGRLAPYHINVVSEYFENEGDFENLDQVCKAFGSCRQGRRINPIPYRADENKLKKQISLISPNIETYVVRSGGEELKPTSFEIFKSTNVKKILYKAGSYKFGLLYSFNDAEGVRYRVVKKTCGENFKVIFGFDGGKTAEFEVRYGFLAGCDSFNYMNETRRYNLIVKYVKCKAFEGAESVCEKEDRDLLTVCRVPAGVTSIGERSFEYSLGLKNIEIPNSVADIRMFAFGSCVSLREVEIPESVQSIEAFAFIYCSNLESVKLSVGLKTIGRFAFSGCKNLKTIEIPEGVTVIGEKCFQFCSGLTKVVIPKSVKSIGSFCFEGCNTDNLKVVYDGKEYDTESFLKEFASKKEYNRPEGDFSNEKQIKKNIGERVGTFCDTYACTCFK